ncbi:MAG: IS630 family transposase [Candidatus Thermoplasmatota archaeon]|nr:IS630 family transposase [Candidatus Thermoplasmatota archaeon]
MKRLEIAESNLVVMALQDEIRRSGDARYDHRLHAILLVAQGMSCPEVARLLGDSPRIVQTWVHWFEEVGLAGLMDIPRPGRPSRLTEEQFDEIDRALRSTPREFGLSGNIWDGKTLSRFTRKQFDVELGVRQCQRIFRQLGFRYRKPRPMIAGTDQATKEEFKKTL